MATLGNSLTLGGGGGSSYVLEMANKSLVREPLIRKPANPSLLLQITCFMGHPRARCQTARTALSLDPGQVAQTGRSQPGLA